MTLKNVDNEIKNILIVDIGSTTTKGLLLENKDGKLAFQAQFDEPTTVEKPFEDVNIGLEKVILGLEEKSNINIYDENKNIQIPFLATSSAGGGLQVLLFGLTKADTGKAVEASAYGAGSVIMETFTVDDKVPEMDKMRKIRELHPDMILIAGGIDGGGLWGILRQAEILSLSEPRSKFMPEEKIPLVFCGNVMAREFIKQMLGDSFTVHTTENIRPNLEDFNPQPVRDKVHQLFMENVMENAPGYKTVTKQVSENILPTPSGVQLMINSYARKHNENMVLVDMGGATTDMFSSIKGEQHRTVSANIGMSYSISNILKEAGIDQILFNINSIIDEKDVRNYITNKMLNPSYVPDNQEERFIELSCAVEGVKYSWNQHKKMNTEVRHIGFLERRRIKIFNGDLGAFEEALNFNTNKEVFFQNSDIDLLIGAGGVISSAKKDEDIVFIMNEGFLPSGITELAVDRHFKSPHLGILTKLNEKQALELFENETLNKICTVISPFGTIKPEKNVLICKDLNENKEFMIKAGYVVYLKNGGNFSIKTEKNISLGKEITTFEIDTDKPILIDARGRGFSMIQSSIFKALYKSDDKLDMPSKVINGRNNITKGKFLIKRSLPYKGEILASVGTRVQIDTVVGQNLFNPPKIYMVDIKRLVGFENKLSKKDIIDGLLVKEGDVVEFDQPVFEYRKGNSIIPVSYISNARGEVIKIDDFGMIVLKEVQDYGDEPVKINVAKILDIKPNLINKYLNFGLGSFVLRRQVIANKVSGNNQKDIFGMLAGMFRSEDKSGYTFNEGDYQSVASPSTGFITEINKETGEVTIQYKSKPYKMHSFVNGIVSTVEKGFSVDIEVEGSSADCVIGFGGENFGELKIANIQLDQSYHDKIAVFFEPVNIEILNKAKTYKVKGIIAPSIDNKDWVDYYGKEIGVALTGKESIDFTLLLTEGFGKVIMNKEYREFFTEMKGKVASVNGRTQIRAGVIRPQVIVS
ncbi:MAG: glutamate mutase L [Candidatus Delongbacteria bacterium]|nr:glutamate mutase L [Candidatus Delongbacteria bacterium]